MNTESKDLSTEQKENSKQGNKSFPELGKQGSIQITGTLVIDIDRLITCDPSSDCDPEGCEHCFLEGYIEDLDQTGYGVDRNKSFIKVELVK